MRKMLTQEEDKLFSTSIKKETAMTPRTRKTVATISRTTVKKENKKVSTFSGSVIPNASKPNHRSPQNIKINFATNESTQSVGKSRASTARIPTTLGVLDSGERTVSAFSMNKRPIPSLRQRKHTSSGPEYRKISQSLIMQEMYDRLSGYDYKYDVESNVSKCSFGSYKEYYNRNPLIK